MKTKDFLPLIGTDFLEFYVSNAKQTAHFYQTVMGFQPYARAGLITGRKELESYVVKQDEITFVFTSPLIKGTQAGKHIDKHGDGVKVIAFLVDDSYKAYEETIRRGATSYLVPEEQIDDNGKVRISGIYTYGDTVHLFIERKGYKGVFLPEFVAWENDLKVDEVGLRYVDHMVGNVDWGQMNVWTKFYEDVLGFTQIISFDDKDISTEFTSLMSKVMSNGTGKIKFPINEPAKGKKKSQIEEYLYFYGGAGVQHIALYTDDIIKTVRLLKQRGMEFLYVPKTYYNGIEKRIGEINEDISPLKEMGILIDRDEDGYLLQLFTKPVGPRPTLFFEIIQRNGAQSFGKGNFKALFEAIEREQESRGTL